MDGDDYIQADLIENARFIVSTGFVKGYEEVTFIFLTDEWAISINTQNYQYITVQSSDI